MYSARKIYEEFRNYIVCKDEIDLIKEREENIKITIRILAQVHTYSYSPFSNYVLNLKDKAFEHLIR